MLNGVCNAAQAFQIHVLIVPEHLCAGVPDQGKLVFVWGLDGFHQGGESMAAAVGGVLSPLYSVVLGYRICNAAGVQSRIEFVSVIRYAHSAAIGGTEQGTGNFIFCQPVNDGLDLWGYGDHTVLSRFCLCPAGKRPFLPVVACNVELQQL